MFQKTRATRAWVAAWAGLGVTLAVGCGGEATIPDTPPAAAELDQEGLSAQFRFRRDFPKAQFGDPIPGATVHIDTATVHVTLNLKLGPTADTQS